MSVRGPRWRRGVPGASDHARLCLLTPWRLCLRGSGRARAVAGLAGGSVAIRALAGAEPPAVHMAPDPWVGDRGSRGQPVLASPERRTALACGRAARVGRRGGRGGGAVLAAPDPDGNRRLRGLASGADRGDVRPARTVGGRTRPDSAGRRVLRGGGAGAGAGGHGVPARAAVGVVEWAAVADAPPCGLGRDDWRARARRARAD